MSSPHASQRPSTSWKRRCFIASENDRAARDLEAFERRYKSLKDVCADINAAINKIDARIEDESRVAAA